MQQERSERLRISPEEVAGIIEGKITREAAGMRISNQHLDFDFIMGKDGLERLEYIREDGMFKVVDLRGRANFIAVNEIHSLPGQRIRRDIPLDSQDFWVYNVSKDGVRRYVMYRANQASGQ